MIYPIILRGEITDIPSKIKDNIHFCDFSSFTLASLEICKNKEFLTHIQDIAKDIYQHYKIYCELNEDVCCGCESFRLPSNDEITPWREVPKQPLPFPGREVKK